MIFRMTLAQKKKKKLKLVRNRRLSKLPGKVSDVCRKGSRLAVFRASQNCSHLSRSFVSFQISSGAKCHKFPQVFGSQKLGLMFSLT